MSTEEDLIQVLAQGALQYASAEARSAYLDGCGANLEVRAKVEARLRTCGEDLTQAAPGLGPMPALPELAMPVVEKPGDRIGRYRLLQKLGEGGFGVVYMAEQEEPVQRRVALKVIKLGMDTRSVVARFEAERQALALMDHPGIARVLDGGVTASGRPYFVMELVKGMRMTEYCDHHKLATGERLELFSQVCHAIQHAHQKGIIHRDIKPSNILVTVQEGTAVPKVIDFGIAKAMDRRLTDKTVLTELEQFIGTPAYVSPEQAEMSGLDIDTRSDIYSLGVLLYELLTGRTPFDTEQLMRAGIDEIRRRIREEEPARPSTRLTTLTAAELNEVAKHHQSEPGKLPHALRGDLDWIVMKALEKDRTRRYATANALAMDIQRHLNHEPVTAAAPGVGYRFAKFARRNRVGLTVAGAMAAMLVLGAVASLWQALRAEANRREAETNRFQAEAAERVAVTNRLEAEKLITFMLDDLGMTLEPFARLDLMEPVIERAAQYYRNRPPGEESSDSEFNRSLSLLHLGKVYLSRDDDRSAESNLVAALRIQERLLERDPGSALWQSGMAKTESSLAWLHAMRRNEAARSRYSEHSHRLLVGLAERFPENIEMQGLLGRSHLDLAGITAMGAELEQVSPELDHLNQAVVVFQGLTNREPWNRKWQVELGTCYHFVGGVYVRMQREQTKGIKALEAAAELYSNAVHGASQNLVWKAHLASVHLDLAYLETRLALWDAAESHALAAKGITEDLLREDKLSLGALEWQLGQGNYILGQVHVSRRDAIKALPFHRDAWRSSLRALARNPRAMGWRDTEKEVFDAYQQTCANSIRQHLKSGQRDLVRDTWLELAAGTRERSRLLDDAQIIRRLLGAFEQVYDPGQIVASPTGSNAPSGMLSWLAPPEYLATVQERMERGSWMPRVLIATNAIWKYLDDGKDPGPDWMQTSCASDAAWKEGPAVLGVGEPFVVTPLRWKEPPGPISSYFRTTFVVEHPEALSALLLRVMVDDGAVFYLNGREMLRVNMPWRAIDGLTLANQSVEADGYTDYLALGCDLLKTNVVAVDVHQSSENSTDLVMGLELQSGLADLAESLKAWQLPELAAFKQAATYLSRQLQPNASAAFWAPENYWREEALDTNRVRALRVASVVIPRKSAWKYLDDGTDQGTAWREVAFNDSAWKQGNGPLGYPASAVSTLVDYGGDPRKKHPSFYLRKTIVLEPTKQNGAWLVRLLVDDAAVVYWNGREVLRHNLPGGEVTFTTHAIASGSMSDDVNFVLPELTVAQATNVLAVGVHQRGWDNLDLAFDLELIAGVPSFNEVFEATDIPAIRRYLTERAFPMPEDLLGSSSDEATANQDAKRREP